VGVGTVQMHHPRQSTDSAGLSRVNISAASAAENRSSAKRTSPSRRLRCEFYPPLGGPLATRRRISLSVTGGNAGATADTSDHLPVG